MIVLTAHGTRDPAGPLVIERLAELVRRSGVPVRVAYADVREPDVTSVLRDAGDYRGPVVVVPAFLASGYHVRTDIPAQIAAARDLRRRDVLLAKAFGPAPELVEVLRRRLLAAGHRDGDAVVLAAAGSSDPRALSEVESVAPALANCLRTPVRIGYAATAEPGIADAVRAARRPGGRVAVASWLLAPGLFQRRVDAAGADVVAGPLCAFAAAGGPEVHPGVAALVLRRYSAALAGSEPAVWVS
ncbi:Sirohydrochlorin ferrochelatase [Amycolatopsis marina]|uniref:Sirohydrochlorin ferrochelatase n=1 Tax=Amycolatopsis marina TaxID=490629 RepID=A0A1I1BNC6_9PSEU|nr:sirohydrochlorin chelatase [Amycolatopsis marina]SFB51332.1 Sirohydrochlorin ferrochelatase [Amycolatopsis marina]